MPRLGSAAAGRCARAYVFGQVPEIRDITGQVIVDAIDGKDVNASAKKAAKLMNRKMEM